MKKLLLIAGLAGITTAGYAQNWLVTGNSGLAAANFLGTTDAVSLTFKVNNQRSGYLDFLASKANTSFGFQSLNVATGTNNAAFGYKSAALTTSGKYNTAAGAYALYFNTAGFSNVAVGIGALYRNTIGGNLVAIGDSALYNHKKSPFNGEGVANTAVGSKSQYSNVSGENNTAVGFHSLYLNTDGHDNTATGTEALFNSNGYGGTNYGSYNTGTGIRALYITDSGYGNTGMGCYSLITNKTGRWNSGLGYSANVTGGGFFEATAIGAFSSVTASYQVRIGSTSVTSIGGYANWSNISDVRVKKNIKQNVPGLAFINKLQPITYNLDLDAVNKITQTGGMVQRDANQEQISKEKAEGVKAKEQVLYTGFAAQDVEKAAKSLGFDFSGVDAPKNAKDLYGLRYSDFVVPLVKAVQELSAKNDDLQNQINELKAMVTANMNNSASTTVVANQAVTLTSSVLEQNIPNPFSNTTSIGYTLPNQYTAAQLVIADKTGKTIKTVSLSGAGKGRISVNASTLSSGAYTYSLYIDNKLIETRQMVLQK